MTTFNTGNPVGSTDGRDLSDNAETIDQLVNGTTQTTTARLGKGLSTINNLEQQYVFTAINSGVWAAGQTFTAVNQYMVFSGTAYKPKNSTTLPYVVGASPVGDGNVEVVANLSTAQGDLRYDKKSTLAAATADPAAVVNMTIRVTDRGDELFDWVSGETPNTFDIVAHDTLSLQLKLRTENRSFNAVAFGASASLADNGPVFQHIHDKIKAAAATAGSNAGITEILTPANEYDFTTGLTLRPWIKFRSLGHVVFDFQAAATTITALRIHNEGETNGDFKNASSNGKLFTGQFAVIGPGKSVGTSIGFDIGNSVAGAATANYRDSILGDIVCQDFVKPLKIRGFDTFLTSIQNARFELGGANVVEFPDSGGVNSGERMPFFNSTFAGGDNAILMNDLGTELVSLVCSYDFCDDSVLDVTDLAGFQSLSFDGNHFENSNDNFLMRGPSTDRKLAINIKNSTILPKNNDNTKTLVRTDLTSGPRIALFTGHLSLSIDGLTFSGYNNDLHSAVQGLFMCDDDVIVASAKNIVFSGTTQSVSKSMIRNFNWDFNTSTTAAVIEDIRDAGWYVFSRSNGIDSSIVASNGFDGSAKALRLSSTFALTEQFTFANEPAAFDSQQIGSNVILFGGTTVGALTVQTTIRFFREGSGSSGPVAGLTRTSTTATANIVAHDLLVGQTIRLFGVVETEWNNIFTVNGITDVNNVTFNALATYNGAPTGTITYETVNSLVPIGDSVTKTFDYKDGYDDTADPSFTGGRNYYSRYKFPHRELRPTGASHASLIVRVTGIDVGKTIDIGGAYLEAIN
jgi:hypothetical protein